MDLDLLIEAANKACREAVHYSKADLFTVNWARINCYEARQWENQDGQTGVEIFISVTRQIR